MNHSSCNDAGEEDTERRRMRDEGDGAEREEGEIDRGLAEGDKRWQKVMSEEEEEEVGDCQRE